MTTRKPTPPDILADILGGPTRPQPAEAAAGLPVYRVPLDRLVDNTYQPRQRNDYEHVLRIARSLVDLLPSLPETLGLQQVPIARLVRWADSSPYPAAVYDDPAQLRALIADPANVVEMAFGHSRRLAFEVLHFGPARVFPETFGGGTEQLANLPDHDPAAYAAMPVILLPLDDATMWRQAITENAARMDITSIEEAAALRRAVDELHMTVEEAGRTLGKSRSAASNLLRLLELPDEYQQAILAGVLSETHGRALLTLKSAMHLVKAPPADLGQMTRRELEKHIAKLIAACRPIAPQPRTGYVVLANQFSEPFDRWCDPPAFPLDWQPDPPADPADPVDAAIVGPCRGCRWFATFAGDPGPRCTQLVAANARACYDAKTAVWQFQQMELQRQAIEARQAQPPTQTSSAGAAAPVSQETPARIYTPANATETPTWFTSKHAWAVAPAALLDKGLCSAQKCECFALAYKATLEGGEVRPDPEGAPNMCYGCTSSQRLSRRRQELEHGDMTVKRAAIKAENAACEERLREALYRLTAQDVWHNTHFMRDLLAAGSLTGGLGRRLVANMEALEIQEHIWMQVAHRNCTEYSGFSVGGENEHWKMEKVDAWLRKLAPGFARQVGGVWAELRADSAGADAPAAPLEDL